MLHLSFLVFRPIFQISILLLESPCPSVRPWRFLHHLMRTHLLLLSNSSSSYLPPPPPIQWPRLQRWSIFRAMQCRWFIFNSDAILIIFWKDLTSPSLRLFFLTISDDYFSIICSSWEPIILRLFTICQICQIWPDRKNSSLNFVGNSICCKQNFNWKFATIA